MENEEFEDLAPTLPFCPRSNRPRKDGPPNLGKEARGLGVQIIVWWFYVRHPAEYSKHRGQKSAGLRPTHCYNLLTDTPTPEMEE
jgi:hypothetical protein